MLNNLKLKKMKELKELPKDQQEKLSKLFEGIDPDVLKRMEKLDFKKGVTLSECIKTINAKD